MGLVDIRDEPSSAEEVLASLDDDASCGLVLFVGRVRDHDGGRLVSGLHYSAHPSAVERLVACVNRLLVSTGCTVSLPFSELPRSRSRTLQ